MMHAVWYMTLVHDFEMHSSFITLIDYCQWIYCIQQILNHFLWIQQNSVNHDKIQEQFGYQRHSISDNRYIPWCSGKKEFSTICRLVSVLSGEWQ